MMTSCEPVAWRIHDADPYRACALCDHGVTDLLKDRFCVHENVASPKKPLPIEQARKHGGACGPEAEYLDFKGLKP